MEGLLKGIDTNFFGPSLQAEPVHHEESITEQIDGQWVNLPTVIGGKKVDPRKAIELYRRKQLEPHGIFADMETAVNAAVERSKGYGNGKH